MLKIVVFDCGYGGELFADQLERELPVVEVIRVIDWRHAKELQSNPRAARKCAQAALRPYIGKADLIIFANYFLSFTSLKHFKRKYKNQRFLGLTLGGLKSLSHREPLILTTKSTTHTLSYLRYLLRTRGKFNTLTLDAWVTKIDNGELSKDEISATLSLYLAKHQVKPKSVVLACSHFNDIKIELREVLGRNLKIYDGFNDTIYATCKLLKIRGGTGKKSKK